MMRFSDCARLMPIYLLLVCAPGCASESSQDFTKKDSPDSSTSDSSATTPNTLPSDSISARVHDSASAFAGTAARSSDCRAQGIGDEEAFARKVCVSARDFGFRAELVHSYGAGGVDVFISEADAQRLVRNRAELERNTTALTEWAKRNYTAFNAVEVTIVGDSKIARGSKLGSRATTVELYGN